MDFCKYWIRSLTPINLPLTMKIGFSWIYVVLGSSLIQHFFHQLFWIFGSPEYLTIPKFMDLVCILESFSNLLLYQNLQRICFLVNGKIENWSVQQQQQSTGFTMLLSKTVDCSYCAAAVLRTRALWNKRSVISWVIRHIVMHWKHWVSKLSPKVSFLIF